MKYVMSSLWICFSLIGCGQLVDSGETQDQRLTNQEVGFNEIDSELELTSKSRFSSIGVDSRRKCYFQAREKSQESRRSGIRNYRAKLIGFYRSCLTSLSQVEATSNTSNPVVSNTTTTTASTDKPVCKNQGSRSEGWFFKGKLYFDQCQNKKPQCVNQGTRSEGYLLGSKLVWAQCSKDGQTGSPVSPSSSAPSSSAPNPNTGSASSAPHTPVQSPSEDTDKPQLVPEVSSEQLAAAYTAANGPLSFVLKNPATGKCIGNKLSRLQMLECDDPFSAVLITSHLRPGFQRLQFSISFASTNPSKCLVQNLYSGNPTILPCTGATGKIYRFETNRLDGKNLKNGDRCLKVEGNRVKFTEGDGCDYEDPSQNFLEISYGR